MDLSSVAANDLAQICSDAGSIEAWNEFVGRFQRPIAIAVLRTARVWGSSSPTVVEDLVQDTFLRLCANECRLLRSFVSREPDSIVGYLKVIAANVTHDHFRSEKSQKRGGLLHRFEHPDGDLDFLVAAPHQRNQAEKAMQMQEIDRALQALMPDSVTDRDRTIFWLYYQQGYSARDIGGIPSIGLSVKGVESSIHRTTTQLRQAMSKPASISVIAKGFSRDPTIAKENG